MTTKRTFIIDYRLEGSWMVDATSAAEAQKLFDNEFSNGLPRFVVDAEVTNDKPYEDK